jgi:class 3 adenylate cyclase/DNA-binding winged helix-turn-helix (wHTH) protein
MRGVRVRILGPVEIDIDGRVVTVSARKERALFCVLASRPGMSVSISELTEFLWADSSPASYRKAIQTYISNLRHLLPAGSITTTGSGYRLNVSPEHVDSTEFEILLGDAARSAEDGDSIAASNQLSEALALWRGHPFDDVFEHPRGGGEVARLEELRRSAEEHRLKTQLQLGRHEVAVADLEVAVTAEPLREQRWALLMLALYRCGRQADALRRYQQLCGLLRDELGLSPGGQLAALEQAILQQRAELDWQPELDDASRISDSGGRTAVRLDPAMTGRQRPAGVVTFCFSDIESSTALMARIGQRAYEPVLGRHRALLRDAWHAHGGYEVSVNGDGFLVAFDDAERAVEACVAGQLAMSAARWPAGSRPLVRMGVHTGQASADASGDYTALAVNQAARLVAGAHGGQVVVSSATAQYLGQSRASLRSLGRHRVRDFAEPVELFQALADGLQVSFPPLRGTRALDPFNAIDLPRWLQDSDASVLVGRSDELHAADAVVSGSSDGLRRALLVTGEPGIGKSRMLSAVAGLARSRGLVVLGGRCDPEMANPYGPISEALRQAVAAIDPEALKHLLGRWPQELVRLIPELDEVLAELPLPMTGDPDTERWRLFDAVGSALSTLGGASGLVLVLDDLQWAPRPMLALLRHLLQRDAPFALTLVASYRDTDIDSDHPLASLLADIGQQRRVETLRLAGLTETSMAALVASVVGHEPYEPNDALVPDLTKVTGGNPYFAREVLRHLAEQGALAWTDGGWELGVDLNHAELPGEVRELIRRRLSRLGPTAQHALRMAAVIGAEFELTAVETLADDGDDCLDALERAAVARLVTEVGTGRWRFVHALVRSAVYDDITQSRKGRCHRRLAEAWEEDGSAPAAAIAHHWLLAAGPDAPTRAARWFEQAGYEALNRLAPERAAGYFQTALDCIDREQGQDGGDRRAALMTALGTAQRQCGLGDYRLTLLSAADQARKSAKPELLARAAIATSRGFWSTAGRVDDQVIDVLEEAARRLPSLDSILRARILATLAGELVFSNARDRRFGLADEALGIARRIGDSATLFDVLANRLLSTIHAENAESCWAEAHELVPLARRTDDPARGVMAAAVYYSIGMQTGHLKEVKQTLADAVPLAAELRRPGLVWLVKVHLAGVALFAGRLTEAESLAREAFALGGAAGEPDAFTWFGAQLAMIRRDQARLDEIIDLVAQAVADTPQLPAWRSFQAVALCELGRLPDAQEALKPVAANGFDGLPRDHLWLLTTCLAADAAVRVGPRAWATQLYDLLRPHGDLPVTAGIFSLGSVERSLGVLARRIGKPEAARRHLERATERNRRDGSPTWTAEALLDLAEVELSDATNQRCVLQAHARVSEARSLVDGLGLERLERRLSSLKPVADPPGGPEAQATVS